MKRVLMLLILTVLSFSINAKSASSLFTKVNFAGTSSVVDTECYRDCYDECTSDCNSDRECCVRECIECCEPCVPPVVEKPCTLVPPRVGRPPKMGYEPNPPHYDVTWECEEDQNIFTRPLFTDIEKDRPETYAIKPPVPVFDIPNEPKPIITMMVMPTMQMISVESPIPLCYTSFIGRCHETNIQNSLQKLGINPFDYHAK